MKALMYHYVRSNLEREPKYYHLNTEDFRQQLDYLKEKYGFIDRDEFLETIRGDREEIPEGVVLTFDDGLRDHYDVVFPELQQRDIWGIFYVPTGPLETNNLLDVHRVHSILGSVSGETLLEQAQEAISEDIIPESRREEFRQETYDGHQDPETTKQAKRLLNYFVPDRHRTAVLDEIIQNLEYDLPSVSDIYMHPSEVREMHNEGMIIGSHTITHPVLSNLSSDEQAEEISTSFDHLDDIVGGLSEKTFCYPYGHESTFTDQTIEILGRVDCEWCFKVESSDVSKSDIEDRIQTLPRFDCNEFPHGDASGGIGQSG